MTINRRALPLALSKAFAAGFMLASAVIVVAISAWLGWSLLSAVIAFLAGGAFPRATSALKGRRIHRSGDCSPASLLLGSLPAFAMVVIALVVATAFGPFNAAACAFIFGFATANFAYQFTADAALQRRVHLSAQTNSEEGLSG